MVQDKYLQDTGEQGRSKQENQERRRRCKRKSANSASPSTLTWPHQATVRKGRRESKLASQKREHESRGARTRRRANGGSLSSRGSATGMQCGLCAVLASLFRRAMCIAGSRRGSGESCYQELTTDIQQGHVQSAHQSQQLQTHRTGSTLLAGSPIKIVLPSRSSSGSFGSSGRLSESLLRERAPGEVTVDSAGQNAVFVRISEEATLPASGISPPLSTSPPPPSMDTELPPDPRPRLLSQPDRVLIEALNGGRCRARHTGRFLTMHKRRRKRLITRSLNQEYALLDDIFHGQVQCVLQKAGNWRFNAFTLETVTGGRSLPVLCVHLFQFYGLFQRFDLDVVRVWKLFALIEEGYHSTNPYHNSIHATDVTQAMHCFLQEEKIKRHLSSLEIMASLIAAVTHDLDHPGVNQPFLVATSNHLATLYENTSVLENHHWRSAIGCLLESGVSEQLPPQIRPELQRHISSLILATDITRQQEFLTRFKSCLDNDSLNMEEPENRHFILQISLKCADISNPCRPWDISRKWSYKVCEEFFRQGDYERQLNLPVTPLCDRQAISIPRIQVGFFEFVVTPLYREWHRFLGDGLSVSLMSYLRENQKHWEGLIARETTEEGRASEVSDFEHARNSSTSDEEPINGIREDSGSVDILLPDMAPLPVTSERRPSLPGEIGPRRVNRRHSVPLSVSKVPFSVMPMIEDSRRESLPDEGNGPSRCPVFRLEDAELSSEALRERSSLSPLSSKSSIYESAGGGSFSGERPVSAENLLPETSIASITNSTAASRLSSVLQPDIARSTAAQTKHLTRQQTFPPLQPYVRIRYMSTTAEMSKCQTETLMEADDSASSSEHSPTEETTGKREPDSDNSKQHSQPETTRFSKEHGTTEHRSSRRREFAFSEFTRQSLDAHTGFGKDYPRRHSVQAVRTEDPNLLGFKNRHGRPSSAQEAYPTQMIYASLTGGTKSTKTSSTCSDLETRNSQTSSVDCNAIKNNGEKCLGLSKLDEISGQLEPRRYSTPTTEAKTPATSNNPNMRRFTAIPVSSEMPARKFFIGSPPGSPTPLKSVSSSSDGDSDTAKPAVSDSNNETVLLGVKRDSEATRQKNSKIAKLSDDNGMKENLDPRAVEESNKSNVGFGRRINQGWARRRGSAPVGLLAKLDDCPFNTAGPRTDRHSSRRGSVPTDIIGHQVSGSFRAALGPRGENVPLPRRASLPQEAALGNLLGNILLAADERENFPANNNNNNNNNNNGSHMGSNNNGGCRVSESTPITGSMPSPRRGSVPADISELRRDLFSRSSVNGKTRNRKKTLRRRSSGGPEMFSGRSSVDNDNDNGKLVAWKRDMAKRDSIPEPSVKRRGSLPVEMVSIFHPGTTAGTRRSSLWRL